MQSKAKRISTLLGKVLLSTIMVSVIFKPGSHIAVTCRRLPQVHVPQAASGDMFTNTFFCR